MSKSQSESHGKSIHLRIAPDNSIPVEEVPRTIPVKFLSPEQIRAQEQDGRTVRYVVIRNIVPSRNDGKPSINLFPLRNSSGDYLVIVCW